MCECFAQGAADRLLRGLLGGQRIVRTAVERDGKHGNGQHHHGHDDQAVRPAVGVDEPLADRGENEHAGRTGRGADAEDDRTLLGWRVTGEGREHDGERARRDAEAHQDATADMQHGDVIRGCHHPKAGGIDDTAHRQHAPGAVAVGDGAKEGQAETPEQVLQRHGETEGGTVPTLFGKHRKLEKAHRRTRPEGDRRDEAAADDDQPRDRSCRGRGLNRHSLVSAGRQFLADRPVHAK